MIAVRLTPHPPGTSQVRGTGQPRTKSANRDRPREPLTHLVVHEGALLVEDRARDVEGPLRVAARAEGREHWDVRFTYGR